MFAKSIFKSSKVFRLAAEHYQAGRFEDARAICQTLVERNVNDARALHLLGRIEMKERNAAEAIELISRAVEITPSAVEIHNDLGDAYLSNGDSGQARTCFQKALFLDSENSAAHNSLGVSYALEHRADEAAECFKRAVRIEPASAVPHFNLGLILKERLQIAAAAKEFHSAWLHDLRMSSAMHEFVNTVGDWARADPNYRGAPMRQDAPPAMSFSIIFCSIDDAKCSQTVELYRRLFDGLQYELIPIRDARSLAEAYNRGVAASKGDVLLLSHDDIDILAPDFAVRLVAHLSRFDVVGVMGATQMTGPSWNWSRHPYLRGWITHHGDQENQWLPLIVDPRPVVGDIVVLDGVLVAAHRAVFTNVTFDEELFDGFHLYDTDWSYRAAIAGNRVGVAGDLMVVHNSRGSYDDIWKKYAQRFCVKHLGDELLRPPPLDLAEASLSNTEEVRAFLARLMDMESEHHPST